MSLSMSLDDDDEDDFLAEKQEQEKEKVVEQPVVEPIVEPVKKTAKKSAKATKEQVIKQVEEKTDENLLDSFESDLKQKILDLEKENGDLQEEISRLRDVLKTQPETHPDKKEDKKDTVSGLLNKLYTLVKEQRTILLLEALKENYFKLKYKSFSVTEIQKMNQQISEKFLAQSLEGKVRAVINANEE